MRSVLVVVTVLLTGQSHTQHIFRWWASPLGIWQICSSVSVLVYTDITFIDSTDFTQKDARCDWSWAVWECVFVCSQMSLVLLGQWFRKGRKDYVYNGVCRSVVRNSAPSGHTFWTHQLCSLFSEAAEASQQVTSCITVVSLNFPREC